MYKLCKTCNTEKEHSEFYTGIRRGKSYLYWQCKSCVSNKNSTLKEYSRNWELLKKYGINIDEYKNQCLIRNNHCDICNEQVQTLHVDHSHTTGKVRGFLCGSCNRGLGLLKDSTEVLNKAIKYLLNDTKNNVHS